MHGEAEGTERHAMPPASSAGSLDPRNMLLGASSLVIVATPASGALTQVQKAAPASPASSRDASLTSSSSWATTSASPTSALTRPA